MTSVGMLIADSSRTRAYLNALEKNELFPACVIYLEDEARRDLPPVPYFDNLTPAIDVLRRLKVPTQVLRTKDVNHPEVIEAVRASSVDVLVYSGFGGAILRDGILSAGKKFLHVHPGLVPRYRGSTTIYYSLLLENCCGASAIFLDRGIDTGIVLAKRVYPAPLDRVHIDHGYDPFIRSDLLIRVLRDYLSVGEFHPLAQEQERAQTYYIMHPVLRHIAILSGRTPEQSGVQA